jgi:hypothetical protein
LQFLDVKPECVVDTCAGAEENIAYCILMENKGQLIAMDYTKVN